MQESSKSCRMTWDYQLVHFMIQASQHQPFTLRAWQIRQKNKSNSGSNNNDYNPGEQNINNNNGEQVSEENPTDQQEET